MSAAANAAKEAVKDVAVEVTKTGLRRNFTAGRKEVFLPNFTITFMRQDKLGPYFASFLVPLHFNKLDMRDYLFHAYNVRIKSVRSYVFQQRVRQGRDSDIRPSNEWFRPRASKKMTVELEKPFVWPAEPDNYEAFDKSTHDAAEKDSEEYQKKRGRLNDTLVNTFDRESMREQAKALLEGRDKWKPMK